MPRPFAGCSETLKRFNEALQRFTEVLSNLTRHWSGLRNEVNNAVFSNGKLSPDISKTSVQPGIFPVSEVSPTSKMTILHRSLGAVLISFTRAERCRRWKCHCCLQRIASATVYLPSCGWYQITLCVAQGKFMTRCKI